MPIVKVGDRSIQYARAGQGATILLIQGVGAAGSAWLPQFAFLSQQFDVIHFDNRGIGGSSPCASKFTISDLANDAKLLLTELGVTNAHIVGHSMGGLIAQQLAVSHRDLVRSLALLCTFAVGSQATKLTFRTFWLGIRTRIGTRRMRRHSMLKMILSNGFYADCNLDEVAEQYGNLMGRDLADSPSLIMKQMLAMSKHNIGAELGRLGGIPTMVLSASQDPIARPEFGKQLSDAIPESTFEVIPNMSHAVTIEQADLVNEKLANFFRMTQLMLNPDLSLRRRQDL